MELLALNQLTKDLKNSALTLSREEARSVVDLYYMTQGYRMASRNQRDALEKAEEPHEFISFVHENFAILEKNIHAALNKFSDAYEVGRWSKSICGIGPVIAAGLIANIDIEKATTAGKIWRFAGLDPTQRWEKGQKRPWNASLKTLCWKAGQCFMKVSNNEKDFYGKIYQEYKTYLQKKNEEGGYREQAAQILTEKKFRAGTTTKDSYQSGILPPAHIDARARRKAVKIFLSHWQEVAWWERFGTAPPKPWIIEHGGHRDYIPVPNWNRQEK